MSNSISMSISDKAYERWKKFKAELGMNQHDAMSKLLENIDIPELIKKVK